MESAQIGKMRKAIGAFENLIGELRDAKPGDRSELDRWHQIVITDIEKALMTYNMAMLVMAAGEVEHAS